jgi:hypothetical protein
VLAQKAIGSLQGGAPRQALAMLTAFALMQIISAACHHVIRLPMARKITCTFIARSIATFVQNIMLPTVFYLHRPQSGQITS